jgi:predicted dienelactone hydrolase
VLLCLALSASSACAAGFQYAATPNADGKAIELGIWYPSDTPTSLQPLGLFQQDVAPYGTITDEQLPLIVISHGTGGGAASHYDTALALANAGFIVVTLSHPGDNYQDQASSFTERNFIERPKHVGRVIDFMLNDWPLHAHVDPARIGMFGHSAGGTTTLVAIGGTPDFGLAVVFCRDHPDSWDCQRAKEKAGSGPIVLANVKPSDWRHDPRIKAAAIAAPALGFTFTKDGLAAVTAPVQLWEAENDYIAPNQWNSDVIKAALPEPPDSHVVPNAGHFAFLAPCSAPLAKIAPPICEDPPGFDRAAFHQQLNQALADFFKAHLPSP